MSDKVYYFGTRPVLPYRPNQVPLDGDMNKVRAIDQTPDGGGRSHKGVNSGRWCNTDYFPTRVEWRGRSNDPATVGDFCTGAHGVFHVSERAREFIEKHEPGVHQFVPFELLKAGKPLESRYWWVVGNRLDSVDHSQTNWVLVAGKLWRTAKNVAQAFPEYLPPDADVASSPRRKFSWKQIGHAQVWRDKYIDTGALVSQAFADALRGSDLTGHELAEADEVN